MLTRSLAGLSGAALLGAAACTSPAPAPTPSSSPTAARVGVETITPQDIFARVSFLASDALRGRDTPSPGLEAAAAYLASEYLRMGLEPAGENGTFYQRYPFASWALDTASVHFGTVLEGMRENRMLAYGSDYFATAAPASSDGEMNHARLVYVGTLGERGLPAGDFRGAAPLVRVPGDYSRDWRTAVSRARRAAQAAGATALVVVVDPAFPAERFRQLAEASRAPQRGMLADDEIPVFHLTAAAAESLAARAGVAADRLRSDPAQPIALQGIDSHFAARARMIDAAGAPNIAAVLRGSDPALRDEYVILSAHMDHVGVGRPVDGDSIYNGADDDASGNAGLLEVAEALASLPTPPRRSVIFLHVSGEEKGLLGSRWYSEHPTVPLERVVANINVDMIGRNAPDSVVVIGKQYSSLGRVVDAAGRAHPELGLTVSDDPWPEERFFFRSDHFNFARKEIPALFFFTGVHEDYHRPSDEVDRLNVDKASRVARLIFHTVRDIANAGQRPTWDPEGLAEVRALTR
jgi:hypothetical protein